MTASKDGIILVNYLHLKFRLVNCLRKSRLLKQLSKIFVQCLDLIVFVPKMLCNLLSKPL